MGAILSTLQHLLLPPFIALNSTLYLRLARILAYLEQRIFLAFFLAWSALYACDALLVRLRCRTERARGQEGEGSGVEERVQQAWRGRVEEVEGRWRGYGGWWGEKVRGVEEGEGSVEDRGDGEGKEDGEEEEEEGEEESVAVNQPAELTEEEAADEGAIARVTASELGQKLLSRWKLKEEETSAARIEAELSKLVKEQERRIVQWKEEEAEGLTKIHESLLAQLGKTDNVEAMLKSLDDTKARMEAAFQAAMTQAMARLEEENRVWRGLMESRLAKETRAKFHAGRQSRSRSAPDGHGKSMIKILDGLCNKLEAIKKDGADQPAPSDDLDDARELMPSNSPDVLKPSTSTTVQPYVFTSEPAPASVVAGPRRTNLPILPWWRGIDPGNHVIQPQGGGDDETKSENKNGPRGIKRPRERRRPREIVNLFEDAQVEKETDNPFEDAEEEKDLSDLVERYAACRISKGTDESVPSSSRNPFVPALEDKGARTDPAQPQIDTEDETESEAVIEDEDTFRTVRVSLEESLRKALGIVTSSERVYQSNIDQHPVRISVTAPLSGGQPSQHPLLRPPPLSGSQENQSPLLRPPSSLLGPGQETRSLPATHKTPPWTPTGPSGPCSEPTDFPYGNLSPIPGFNPLWGADPFSHEALPSWPSSSSSSDVPLELQRKARPKKETKSKADTRDTKAKADTRETKSKADTREAKSKADDQSTADAKPQGQSKKGKQPKKKSKRKKKGTTF